MTIFYLQVGDLEFPEEGNKNMTAWVDLKTHDGVRLTDKEGKEVEKDKWEEAGLGQGGCFRCAVIPITAQSVVMQTQVSCGE